jgi:co-chaperonin GroES (HSP10)
MRLKPKGYKLLVKLDAVKERKVGSIYVSDEHREQARIGTILEIGSKVTDYNVGDRVVVNCFNGIAIDLFDYEEADGESLRMFVDDEILCTVEN